MAIPDKALDLNLDAKSLEDMTLEDVAIFDAETAASAPFTFVNQIRRFLLKYSLNWSPAEINAITVKEMQQVAEQLTDAINRLSVPLASSPPSKTGEG